MYDKARRFLIKEFFDELYLSFKVLYKIYF